MGFKGVVSRCYEPGSCGRCDPEGELKRMPGERSDPGRDCGHPEGQPEPREAWADSSGEGSKLGEKVEVVEVSSHLPSRLVVGRDLPALKLGHHLGERGMLNAPRYL